MRWHSGTIGRRSATAAAAALTRRRGRMPTATFAVAIIWPSTPATSSAAATAITASTAGPLIVRHRNTSRSVATVMVTHPPERIHWPPESVGDAPCRRFLRVRTGRVDGATLDEHSHHDDEQDAHKAHHVPVFGDPLGHGLERLPVKQQILEPYQRAFGVDGAAL